jgi:hypothetical protein
MASSSLPPAPGGGPEPAPSLASLSLSSQISDGVGGGGGGDAPGASELPLPAVGARVRCEGLTGAAELNGCLGRVVSHEGARAKVLMDGPGGRVVGVKQGLTLDHCSAQLEPCLKQSNTLYTPPNAPSTRATQPLRAPPIPFKALKLSRQVDECKPLASGRITWSLSSDCSTCSRQGLILVHFSAQLECFVWDRGARRGCVARNKGVLGVCRMCRVFSCVRHSSS